MSKTKKIILTVTAIIAAVICVTFIFHKASTDNSQSSEGMNTTDEVTQTATMQMTDNTEAACQTEEALTDAVTEASESAVAQPPTVFEATKEPTTLNLTQTEPVKMLVDAINSTKDRTDTFSAHHLEQFDVKINRCTSGDAVVSMANRIAGLIISPTDETLTFVNGKAKNASGEEISVLFPSNGYASLTESGVSAAKLSYNGENTVIELSLYPEDAGLDKIPTANSALLNTFNVEKLNFGFIKITKFDFTYTGTTVKAEIDPAGFIVSIHYFVPVEIEAVGKLGFGSGSASVTCNQTITWEIENIQ